MTGSRRRRAILVYIASLCLRYDGLSDVAAFMQSDGSRRRRGPLHQIMSSTTNIQLEEKLQKMTVKELRQLVKDSSFNKRGVLSALKVKSDLVNFLADKLDQEIPVVPNQETVAAVDASPVKVKIVRNPTMMPPLSEDNDADDNEKSSSLSPKETAFEKVYEQYPTLRNLNTSYQPKLGEFDIRQTYHPIFKGKPGRAGGDLDIVFVGTASCVPGVTRGVSCTALRMHWNRKRALRGVPGSEPAEAMAPSATWIFDCGESTQLQIQRTSTIRSGKISKIFLTHAHGDHSFGLPGLLCLMGQDRDRESSPVVDIYGPEGLRMWLRVAIRYSVSRVVPNYRVHELKEIPMAPEWQFNRKSRKYYHRASRGGRQNVNGSSSGNSNQQWGFNGLAGEDPASWISQAPTMTLEPSTQYAEVAGGRDIYPQYNHPSSSDGAPVWEVEDGEDVKVFAAPMSHGIPCVGYVVEETDQPGRLKSEYVQPIVKRNLEALKEAGFKVPMKAMAVIKNLPEGQAFTFPDGTIVRQSDAVEPPRKGRKVVICGDTNSARAMEGLAQNADVVIHEATNSFLPGIDKETNMRAVTRDAISHGHSTPQLAGDFCKRVGAKRLLMNHFSPRYKGDQSVESFSIMNVIESQAESASGLSRSDIAAVWDFMILPVLSEEKAAASTAEEEDEEEEENDS